MSFRQTGRPTCQQIIEGVSQIAFLNQGGIFPVVINFSGVGQFFLGIKDKEMRSMSRLIAPGGYLFPVMQIGKIKPFFLGALLWNQEILVG